jgi:hypothetical protein
MLEAHSPYELGYGEFVIAEGSKKLVDWVTGPRDLSFDW